MSTRSINCPGCGGKIEFQASAYLPGECTYCGASIAPVKDQTFSEGVKLNKEEKVVKIAALPGLENKAKKKGLSLSKLLVTVTLVGGVVGFLAWQKSNEYKAYWKHWETTLEQMPCKPPSSLVSKNPQVLLNLGSFQKESFLFSASTAFGPEFSQCLKNHVEFRQISTKNSEELILGSVIVKMVPGKPVEILEDSIALHRISSNWALDVYNEQKKKPEIDGVLSNQNNVTTEMWACWVQFGILNRKGSNPFNKYTGDSLNVPIRLVINEKGQIGEAIVTKPKSKDAPSTWEDQPDFYQCMNTAAQMSPDWPTAAHGQTYRIAYQLEVNRAAWK